MKQLEAYDTALRYQAVVKETYRITPNESPEEVRHIVLHVQDDMNYQEGQNIGLIVPGPHDFGESEHFRLYTIANTRDGENGHERELAICVRRCMYIDPVTGEEYKGVASNYLCDRRVGDEISITGPYPAAFMAPKDKKANLLMVAMGTGIAPFRAFIKQLYGASGEWEGQVRLFYGARTGLEMIYMNDIQNDFSLYYDRDTFKAFQAISPKPHLGVPIALDHTLKENSDEVFGLIQHPNTYVYLSGVHAVAEKFNNAMVEMAGSEDRWNEMKEAYKRSGRWAELLY